MYGSYHTDITDPPRAGGHTSRACHSRVQSTATLRTHATAQIALQQWRNVSRHMTGLTEQTLPWVSELSSLASGERVVVRGEIETDWQS